MEISEETDLSFLCIDIYIPMWTNNNQLNHQPNSANQIISPNLKERPTITDKNDRCPDTGFIISPNLKERPKCVHVSFFDVSIADNNRQK